MIANVVGIGADVANQPPVVERGEARTTPAGGDGEERRARCIGWRAELAAATCSSMGLIDTIGTWLPFGRVPEVAPRALAGRLDSVVVLDVRTTAEHSASRIPGALSVPIQELARRIDELELSTDEEIVVICLSAHRSIPAVRLLRERGFARAAQLHGGMLAWWAAGLPTERPP